VGLSHNWVKKIRSPWVESRNNTLHILAIFFAFFLTGLSFNMEVSMFGVGFHNGSRYSI
jgi:hypothetical protein